MGNRLFDVTALRILRECCGGKTTWEIAETVNMATGRSYTRDQVRCVMKRLGIKSGRRTGLVPRPWNSYPPEVTDYIMANYRGVGPTEMAGRINREFGTSYTSSQIIAWYKNHHLSSGVDTRYRKGSIPWTRGKTLDEICGGDQEKIRRVRSTQFKTGGRPHNALPVGSEIVRDDGYRQRKVAEPNVWRFSHHIVWEENFGPVPEGMMVTFLDGDKSNLDPENLFLISQEENRNLNYEKRRSEDGNITKAGIGILRLEKAIERRTRYAGDNA